jgi:NADH dehydrogenase [ubiquinone] 1 alpha subcomplex assembly factor 7
VHNLAERLRRRIEREGPISLSEYMASVLTEPQGGYYGERDPLGEAGDFTTAPEISQMFGELLGLWALALWESLGRPSPFSLVELGPGRGTLIADALRAQRLVPEFLEALSLNLVEVSPHLMALQKRRIAAAAPDVPAYWHPNLGEVPDGPMVLIANEFFDALPVKQFEMTPDGWAERLVGLSPSGDGFAFGLGPAAPLHTTRLPGALHEARPGQVAEVSAAALSTMSEIARRVAAAPGGALIVDYGPAQTRLGATLQAVRAHRRHDPLNEPGSADLTAHIDFQSLAAAAQECGAAAYGPLPQGEFLARLGIQQRAERLSRDASPKVAATIDAGMRRLTDPNQMGTLFKALALVPPQSAPPPGFDGQAAGH